MIMRFIVFGMLGLAMEGIWTGLGSLKNKDLKATSKSSIWMFFIYGMASFFTPLIDIILPFHWAVRGLIYAFIIFALEYIFGRALKRWDACPWDYSHIRFNVHGVIRLDYLPVWAFVGFFMEYIYINFLLAL